MTDVDGLPLDVLQLDADLEFIWVEKSQHGLGHLAEGFECTRVWRQPHVRRGVQVVYRNLRIGSGRADGSVDGPKAHSKRRISGRCHRAVGREV